MPSQKNIAIIGGGLAGSCAAIHLRMLGFEVTVFEKDTFPRHKVCGEYISNEVVPYLEFLGIDVFSLTQIRLDRFQLTAPESNIQEYKLPLGGFGLSRFTLDHALYKRALALGVTWITTEVNQVQHSINQYVVTNKNGENFEFDYVCCAYGKRSVLDHKLQRNFIVQKAPWIGVKYHAEADFPDDLVALHHFYGGYCGLSKTEFNTVNVCYLATFESFKPFKNTSLFEKEQLSKNPHLKHFLEQAKPWNQAPLSISQISFENKTAVENHMLMLGDAAGLIHPLCGNGMAMAMHSAAIAVETLAPFLEGSITLTEMEMRYQTSWSKVFSGRLKWGKTLGSLLINPKIAPKGIQVLSKFPFLLHPIIRKTHGKPFDFLKPKSEKSNNKTYQLEV